MTYEVRILMVEPGKNGERLTKEVVHLEGQYEFHNLELAREAAELACHAAVASKPERYRATSDEDWKAHPDRSDADDV